MITRFQDPLQVSFLIGDSWSSKVFFDGLDTVGYNFNRLCEMVPNTIRFSEHSTYLKDKVK